MMPRRVRLAVLIAFLGHGLFILTARYRLSYDAYTHMFFADHYLRDWWSLWEARWFGGFQVVSYPPLVHQTIGLLGHLTGVDAAYALLAWAVLTAYPLGVYAFSRIFCGRSASAYAALGAALLPSVYYSAHAFGQLPTLTATLFALFGLAALAEFLRTGGRLSGALAVSLMTVTLAAHHATLLFLPWAIAAVVLHILLNLKVDRAALFRRLSIFAACAIPAGLLVIWPFWAWGAGQTMQTPIDHLSRHNFFTDRFAFLAFFLPMYGPLIALIPFALWKGFDRRFAGLAFAFLPLFLLGLGGTTPLPRWLFGAGWEWLTYDRFALWASLLLLPFFGTAILSMQKKLPRLLTFKTEVAAWRSSRPSFQFQKTLRVKQLATALTLGSFALASLIVGFIPELFHTQPGPLNMQPVVDFLATDGRSDWRYLTFGFGDQLAYLSRLTVATTLDGSYFTARSLPELRESGIGQIDTVYWSVKGVSALDPILQESGERGVRWGFVNRPEFIPELLGNGWVFVGFLSNGVQVWENPHAILPVSAKPPADPLASFSWGTLPLLSLFIAGALSLARLRPALADGVLTGIQTFAVGLLPVSLVFWYFRQLTDIEYSLVYFTYDNALFFLSDALALIAVLSWSIHRLFVSPRPVDKAPTTRPFSFRRSFSSAKPWLLGLCLLASLSIFWSQDWRISLYVSLHLWLVFGLFLSLQDRPELWHAFAFGSCAALALQIFFGLWQFAAQSTAFMAPLQLNWPGSLEPAMRGVSVVQLFDGSRLLRAYGSLPHPNILAGLLLALLPGPVTLFMSRARRNAWLAILFGLTMVLLILTFSRAAWIGLAVAALVLALHRQHLNRKRLITLAGLGSIGLLAVLIPLRQYILVRVTDAPVFIEQSSREMRVWLVERSFVVIREHPWLGTGIGAYTIASARGLSPASPGVTADFLVEPVHNVPLLAQGELGIGGTLVLLGLGVTILLGAARARGVQAIIFSSTLVGISVVELFDHFLWTLAPGRLLFGLILGLWAAQMEQAER